MFFFSETIIVGLLGEKWRTSIVFFQILIFSTISLPLRSIVFKAILSLGFSRVKFKLGLINNAIRLSSIPVGYYFGIVAFAWTVVLGRFLIVVVSWIFFQRLVSFSLAQVIKPVLLPVLILFFWVALYYSKLLDVNMLLYLPPFLISLFLTLWITKNFGFMILIQEMGTINQRLRKGLKR